MFASILSAIAAIREILGTIKAVMAWVDTVKEERWWKDWTQLRSDLVNAKTTEERKALARRVRDSLGSI